MAEPRRMAGVREYVGRRRQYMSDGLPYNTHNYAHYLERYGMRTWARVKAGEWVDVIVGVYADTPAKMAAAVIMSRR